jgi:long-chain acyl-CoA synthetase
MLSELYQLSYNAKGREYVGSNFQKTPRPERFKQYDGSSIRLKTSMADSNGEISEDRMDLHILEKILLSAYSVTSVKFYGYQSEMVWSIPSAGACYPVEVYVINRSLEGINPGAYYYSALETSLYRISDLEYQFLLNESLLSEDQEADFYLVFTIIPWRSCWKYSYRGYRFCLLDAGHMMANFQLVLNSLNVATTAYTHCRSQHLKVFMHLDKLEEPVGVISVKNNKGVQSPLNPEVINLQYINQSKSRSVFNEASNFGQFDWSPIVKYQEMIKASTNQPTPLWRSSYCLPKRWNQLDDISPLLIKRRSCSAFLPVCIANHEVQELVDFIHGMHIPITIYGIIHAVEGVDPGIYKLDAQYKLLRAGDFREQSTKLCLDQDIVYDCSILLFFVVCLEGMKDLDSWRLQQRLIEAGALAQMIYLKCKELKLGYSAVGGYYDLEVRDLLQLNDDFEVIYSGVVGKEDVNAVFQIKNDRFYLNKPMQSETALLNQEASDKMIIDQLRESVDKYNDHPAILCGNETYTYKELWRNIESYATYFNNNIPHKYPVGIYMKNDPKYIFTYYGLLLGGYIPMLIDFTLTDEEVNFIRTNYHIGSIVYLTDENQIGLNTFEEDYLEFDNDQFANVATCRFSSGTTGIPKCLMFTYKAIINAAVNWAKASSISQLDRVLCTAVFHNGLAFNTSLLSVFLSGASLVICRQITPRAIWEIVKREKVTILVAFPIVYDMLNKSKYCDGQNSLRLCISSAAKLNNNVKQAFKEKVGLTIGDYYGIVEAGPATFNSGLYPDSLGCSIDGVQLRIVNDDGVEIHNDELGTLQIKSSSMAKGYYNVSISLTELITPDGYYHTSDRAYIRNGQLYVTGRTNDIINVAGKKVDPQEIENVLLSIDGINDCAVVGVMNTSLTSEYPLAFIVFDTEMEEKQIVRYCQENLAPFKLPQKFIRTSFIPRNGAGKIKRQELIDSME